MQIHANFPLLAYNTFGIAVQAKQFVSVESVDELRQVFIDYPTESKFILGGGSNMLLTKNIEALVIHLNIKGKEIVL
jgi:UDP-N-acetylmuramate dehydrogenase